MLWLNNQILLNSVEQYAHALLAIAPVEVK